MKYILSFLLIIVNVSLSAQRMELQRYSSVKLDGNVYNFKKSEELFKQAPIAYEAYLSSKQAQKASKGWGYTSLASLGGGLFLTLATPGRIDYCDTYCFSDAQVFGILSVLFVFPIAGTIGIINNSVAKHRFKKAVGLYNGSDYLGYEEVAPLELSFGLSQNGVGLVLKF